MEKRRKNVLVRRCASVTLLIEFVTIMFRFGFRLESTRDTASTVGVLTRGVRIHHGYIGVLLCLLAIPLRRRSTGLYPRVLVSGIALFCSDLIHHFLVLWPLTGKHQFDLRYPPCETLERSNVGRLPK